jgi:hypothetical protein
MAKKPASNSKKPQTAAKPSVLVDTRVIFMATNTPVAFIIQWQQV